MIDHSEKEGSKILAGVQAVRESNICADDSVAGRCDYLISSSLTFSSQQTIELFQTLVRANLIEALFDLEAGELLLGDE
jgi:hypothetical protein